MTAQGSTFSFVQPTRATQMRSRCWLVVLQFFVFHQVAPVQFPPGSYLSYIRTRGENRRPSFSLFTLKLPAMPKQSSYSVKLRKQIDCQDWVSEEGERIFTHFSKRGKQVVRHRNLTLFFKGGPLCEEKAQYILIFEWMKSTKLLQLKAASCVTKWNFHRVNIFFYARKFTVEEKTFPFLSLSLSSLFLSFCFCLFKSHLAFGMNMMSDRSLTLSQSFVRWEKGPIFSRLKKISA